MEKNNNGKFIIVIVLLVVCLGLLGYLYYKEKSDNKNNTQVTTTTTTTQKVNNNSEITNIIPYCGGNKEDIKYFAILNNNVIKSDGVNNTILIKDVTQMEEITTDSCMHPVLFYLTTSKDLKLVHTSEGSIVEESTKVVATNVSKLDYRNDGYMYRYTDGTEKNITYTEIDEIAGISDYGM